MTIAPLLEDLKISEPAKRWRNKYWTLAALQWDDSPSDGPGEFLGANVFPSKEIAEQKAQEFVVKLYRAQARHGFSHVIKHIRAFPLDGKDK